MDHEDRRVRDGYDGWAAFYDDADPTTRLDEPLIRKLAAPVRGRRVLDLGCGTGRYARLLAADGARVVGLDLSAGMLARARCRPAPGPVRWVQGRADRLPFRDGAFDRVVSGLVIDHLPDLRPFFAEIARVLRPGGRAVVTGVHPDRQRRTGPAVRPAGASPAREIPGHLHEIAAVLAAAGGAGLRPREVCELRLTPEMVAGRPDWAERVGEPALLLLAAEKRAT